LIGERDDMLTKLSMEPTDERTLVRLVRLVQVLRPSLCSYLWLEWPRRATPQTSLGPIGPDRLRAFAG